MRPVNPARLDFDGHCPVGLGMVLMLYVSCPLLRTPPKKALGEGSTPAGGC
jgi:hypothetical protein